MKPANKNVRIACAAFAAVAAAVSLSGCNPADQVSQNLSTAADNYQIERQINLVDTITNQNMVTIRGLCALGNNDKQGELTVTCKVGDGPDGKGEYIKDFFGISNTVTYSVVQVGAAKVDSAHYSIVWNPGALVPTFRGVGGDPLTQSVPSSQTVAPGQTQTTRPSAGVITTISP
jgi:hypothetical protein